MYWVWSMSPSTVCFDRMQSCPGIGGWFLWGAYAIMNDCYLDGRKIADGNMACRLVKSEMGEEERSHEHLDRESRSWLLEAE